MFYITYGEYNKGVDLINVGVLRSFVVDVKGTEIIMPKIKKRPSSIKENLWKRHSFFSEYVIDDHSLAHCECELHFMDQAITWDDAISKTELSSHGGGLLWSKHCTVHICKIPNVMPDLARMKQDTGYANQIFLNVVLNRLRKGDVTYERTDRLWHQCRQKVGTKWQTFMLQFEDQNQAVFQDFQYKLDDILQQVQTSHAASHSYHLVAVEGKVDQRRNSKVGSRIFDDDIFRPQRKLEESLEVQNQSFDSGSENQSSLSSSEEENNKVSVEDHTLSLLPPFDPAPYTPGFPDSRDTNYPEYKSADWINQAKRSIIAKNDNQESLCDSLHIHAKELPQSLESILHSENRSGSTYLEQIHEQEPSQNHAGIDNFKPHGKCSDERLASEFLPSEELYIQMGVPTDTNMAEKNTVNAKNTKLENGQKLGQLLETAINDKDVKYAQEYAKELAIKDVKVKIEVVPKSKEAQEKDNEYDLKVYIEDKESSGGYITLKVRSTDTIRDLKNRMLMKHMFPVEVQNWIIGKRIRGDTEMLAQCGVKTQGHSAFLYLVSAKSAGVDKDEFQLRVAALAHTPGGEYVAISAVPRPPPAANKAGNQAGNNRRGSTPNQPAANIKEATIPEENIYTKNKDQKRTPEKLAPNKRFNRQQGLQEGNPHTETGPEIARILNELGQNIQVPQTELEAEYLAGRTGHQAEYLAGRTFGAPRVPVMHPEEEEPMYGWACAACTFINQPTRPGCEVCGNPRPEDYVVPPDYVISEEEKKRLHMEQVIEQQTKEVEDRQRMEHRQEMLRNFEYLQSTDAQDVIPNTEIFSCPICFDDINVGDGVVLRECLHSFCRECLREAVVHNEEPVLRCPYQDEEYSCSGQLQHREIKGVVAANLYEKYLARSLATAESQAKNSFHCKTADCPGWCTYEDHVNFFVCPVCSKENCLTCKAIHSGMNCKQYQEDLKIRSKNDKAASQTQVMIKKMLDDGDAMACPQCQVIVMKKEGCDWIQCSICKTEICWVTKGPRWGPMGSGDITAGCMCRVDGQMCHPECNNCH